ncbi:NAD(P)-dependent oxidoreductase [Pelotomaculum terephthalicicum JT]|uniref:SDR family oxidoreductase n=1 Tax=Pelotomaculum terephthalicicum TaxID=206393 RepID=UPI0009D16A6D|nr:NAD(P)-dependent oxidoreductase [Pelotomaculum terephthalicicum]MCG9966767.1 NAD(P)-dependent oxidoreductase [Pelotomaculum terephthalicicum JT]OPY60088.1 MAG: dTDP-4-dehydrorhamnose reductase [Pelotomaculum sp. PtaU1.Bin065]
MKILIIGVSGQIGFHLYQAFAGSHQVSGTYFSYPVPDMYRLDMTKPGAVKDFAAALNPDIIFLPAAMPDVEACEKNPALCYGINVDGTRNVLTAASEISAKVVFFSTDYLFDGAAGPYAETERPKPLNIYGKAKNEAEQLIRQSACPHLIVRTSVVYGYEKQGKNFVVRLSARLRRGEKVKAPIDQLSTPTYAPNLCAIIKELVERDKEGTYHIAGPELMNRYDFALLAAEIFGLERGLIVPATTEELGQQAPRPLRGGLKVGKVCSATTTRLMNVREGLIDMKKTMESNATANLV